MEKFSLDIWLKDKSRKVVTRDGRKVNILKYDAITPMYPVIVSIIREDGVEVPATYTKEGHDNVDCLMHNEKNDLFFADKEEELTEFEKEVKDLINSCCNEIGETIVTDEWAKDTASALLDLARKELMSEISDFEIYDKGFKEGKKYALKDLPKLEKTKEVLDPTIPVMYTNAASMKSYVEYNGYKVCINELFETLPKEE